MNLQTAVESAPRVAREGLPYWIFWLLLCLIFLLLAFIFLRDKDLRRRLNETLSGGKRRVKRVRLRLRLKREKRRRDELHRELGRTTWIGRLEPARFEAFFGEVEKLENAASALQTELNDTRARILALQTSLDEARRRRKDLQKQKEEGRRVDVQAVRAAKHEEAVIKKEMKSLNRRLQAGQSEVRNLETEKNGHLRSLGETIDEARLERAEFVPVFAQIDRINRNILTYIDQIEKLK